MKFNFASVLQFFLFVIAQVVVTSYVNFSPYIYICFYPLFILSMPKKTPHMILLSLSFSMGLLIDILTNGIWGINAAAATFLAYIQPALLKVIFSKGELENQIRPGLADLGMIRYSIYIFSGLLIHLSIFSIIENFGTPFIFENLLRMVISIIINTLIILLIEFGVFYKNTR